MRATLSTFAIVGILLLATSAVRGTVLGQATLTQATGGYFTLNALGPATLLNTAVFSDQDLATSYSFTGLEGISNGTTLIDTGGWVLLDFQTPFASDAISIQIQARSFSEPQWSTNFLSMLAVIPGDSDMNDWPAVQLDQVPNDNTVRTISGTFDHSGNTFHLLGTNLNSGVSIDQIRLPGNHFQVLVSGPYTGGLHYVGPDGVTVFDASMQYSVPEPAISLIGICAVIATQTRRLSK